MLVPSLVLIVEARVWISAITPSSNLTVSDVLFRSLSVLLLIAINAFFVAAEFSIVSVRRSRINQLVSTGDVPAKTVQNLQHKIERLLSATQIGITLSSLALGWIGEGTLAVIMVNLIEYSPLPDRLTQMIAHSLAVPLSFLAIAYLQIVLGELCPKSVALLYPEQLARWLGPLSLAIARFFNPFIWILNESTRLLLRLVGVQYTGQGWYNQVTPEELQLIIASQSESTGLETEERELLQNVFEFGDIVAAEIMVPRTRITALESNTTFGELLTEIVEKGYSRYPVMGESLDDIKGILDFKQLIEPLAKGELFPKDQIDKWLRPARFIPKSKPLNELLPIMQRSHQEMAIVVDEFGGTAGLVTITDIIAEIIGNTEESENPEEVPLQRLDEQNYLVQAQLHLEEVNDLLNLELPLTDEYQTLGGFMIYHLQKIPAVGETLHYQNLELTVESAEGPRLLKIRVRQLDSSLTHEIHEELVESSNADLTSSDNEKSDREVSEQETSSEF